MRAILSCWAQAWGTYTNFELRHQRRIVSWGVCAVLDGRVVAEAHEQRDSESAINTFILELSDC